MAIQQQQEVAVAVPATVPTMSQTPVSDSQSVSQLEQQTAPVQEGWLARLRGGAHPIAECLACCCVCLAAEDIAACLCLDSLCFCCSEA
ncbi:hypothetical protein PYCC9005_005518 [Savitreella phatthalungensis]